MYKIVKNYRDHAALRASFNALAGKTFGLDFEDWYQNGFWGDNYNPYSVMIDGQVVSNVSVNRTDMLVNHSVKHFIQLGTVMTDEAYRNQGLIRMIMEEIEADHGGRADGFYLFANDSVLDFYPKFGFEKSAEYQYTRNLSYLGKNQFEKVVMDNPGAWNGLRKVMDHNVFHGKFDMINNDGLILFYATGFLRENVFYHKESDTYVIAEKEEEKLFLHNVFSSTVTDLDAVLKLFGTCAGEVVLGFVPENPEAYQAAPHLEEDCTFFIKGEEMKIVEMEKLRIPSLSHA